MEDNKIALTVKDPSTERKQKKKEKQENQGTKKILSSILL
jgi:hypothetical protein